MNKKISLFTFIFIGAIVLLIAYEYVPAVQNIVASVTEEGFSQDNIYFDLNGVANRLDEEILKGSESFTIYLRDMDIDEINGINTCLAGVFGSGKSYQQIGRIGRTYKKIVITVERTTNYYVYAAYKFGDEIPDTEHKAKDLYAVVKRIMETQVSPYMSDFDKELAIHDYLVKHCKYSDIAVQNAQSDIYRAYGALVNGDAVCNGYAEAVQLLLSCAGVDSKFVIGNAGGVDHAWNLVRLDGNWYHLDATWDDPTPDRGEGVIHPYFNVSDEIIKKSHTWEENSYPEATEMTYNFYIQKGTYFSNVSEYSAVAYSNMLASGNRSCEAVIQNYRVTESDVKSIFLGNGRYQGVSWQHFGPEEYSVIVVDGR